MLNPVFSLANMRDILPAIQPIADQLRTILTAELPADGCRLSNILYRLVCSTTCSGCRGQRAPLVVERGTGIHMSGGAWTLIQCA